MSLENWLKSPKNRRLFAQEGLILEASEAIWKELNERKMNQVELSRLLGRSEAYVSQLLDGSRNMTLRTLADIAHVLDMDVKISLEKRQ